MLRKTALYNKHIEAGAKTGAFAGYDMPLYYKDGVIKEHEFTRAHAGIFDVSHMGQVMLEGPGTAAFLERITPSSFRNKKTGKAQYTVLMNETGGIIDDLIVTKLAENKFYAVLNAGCKDKDMTWIKEHLPSGVKMFPMEKRSLIAVQGPWAERILHEILEYDARTLGYMHVAEAKNKYGIPLLIARLGYTGEDGFEISLPDDEAPELWDALTHHAEATPVGLAARDSLRLEMGYPLYGHDIDDKTSPVEADIAWIIGKDNTGFIGADRVLKELREGTTRKRIGLKLLDQGVAREGAELRDSTGRKIGIMTSGGFSPSLKQSVGQGYAETAFAKPATKIFAHVRGRDLAAEITAMPFVPTKTKAVRKAA